jgi:periplasmic copper chaperone A
MHTKTVSIALLICTLTACGPKPETAPKSSVVTVGSTETVNGQVVNQSGIRLTNFSIAPVRGQGTATAAYVTVSNTAPEGDRLLSVACDCAAEAGLHTMTMKDGMMDMAEVKAGFEIPPGQTLVLAPGGNHIMLTGLKGKPATGDSEKLTLTFAKAGKVTIDAPVR